MQHLVYDAYPCTRRTPYPEPTRPGKTVKLDPHTNPAFRPPLSLPGGPFPTSVPPSRSPAHGAASHFTNPRQLFARPSYTANVTTTPSADLLCNSLQTLTMGTGPDESNTNLPCRNDVRGRLISRRGCSVYDIFQQLYGPGYSREEIDYVLRIPAVRFTLGNELRRRYNIHQRACHHCGLQNTPNRCSSSKQDVRRLSGHQTPSAITH